MTPNTHLSRCNIYAKRRVRLDGSKTKVQMEPDMWKCSQSCSHIQLRFNPSCKSKGTHPSQYADTLLSLINGKLTCMTNNSLKSISLWFIISVIPIYPGLHEKFSLVQEESQAGLHTLVHGRVHTVSRTCPPLIVKNSRQYSSFLLFVEKI